MVDDVTANGVPNFSIFLIESDSGSAGDAPVDAALVDGDADERVAMAWRRDGAMRPVAATTSVTVVFMVACCGRGEREPQTYKYRSSEGKSVVSRASAGTVSRHAPSIALFLAARAEYRTLSSS